MLGKGLESLLPKRASGGESRSKDAVVSPPRGETPLVPQPRSPLPTSGHPARSVSLPGRQAGETLSRTTPHPPRKVHEDAIFQIEVERIRPNPYQPRRAFKEEELQELAASIREFGVLQPLVVSKRVEETPHGTVVDYELIAGERRLLAAKRAGLERVPAVVKQTNSRQMKLEVALIENLQRSDLSALEAARAYARLQEEFGLTQREIAVRVSKSREAVANTLRLLQLPSEALQALSDGKISESQARTLLSVEELSARIRLFQEFLAGRTTVRAVREKKSPPQSPEDIATVRALEEKLGTPVKVVRKRRGGTITITFYSDEEYRGVRSRLLGEEW